MSSSTKSDLCIRTILFCLFIFVIPFINVFERSLGHTHAPFIGSLAGLAQHGAGLFDEAGCIIITVTAIMLILKAIHQEYSLFHPDRCKHRSAFGCIDKSYRPRRPAQKAPGQAFWPP